MERAWIHLLVRNIRLAEPLVEEFGQCIAGVSPGRAEVLAGSFALDECGRRDELTAVLREHLT